MSRIKNGYNELLLLAVVYFCRKRYVVSYSLALLSRFFCQPLIICYYTDASVLLENTTLIKFIRNYIRDRSCVFSTNTFTCLDIDNVISRNCKTESGLNVGELWINKFSKADIKSFNNVRKNAATKKETS